MGLKTFACALALTLSYTVTAFGAEPQTALQTLSSDVVEAASNEAIPMTGSKIVTDDFLLWFQSAGLGNVSYSPQNRAWKCTIRRIMRATDPAFCFPSPFTRTTATLLWRITPFSDSAEVKPLC